MASVTELYDLLPLLSHEDSVMQSWPLRYSEAMGLLRWMRESFERYSPGLGAVLPWVGGALLLLALGFGLRSWDATRSRLKATATVTDNAANFCPGWWHSLLSAHPIPHAHGRYRSGADT